MQKEQIVPTSIWFSVSNMFHKAGLIENNLY